MRLRDFPSRFRMSAGPSVIIHKHFVRPRDLPLTSIKFPCACKIFCLLLSTFRASVGPSVKLPCIRRTFRLLPSTFRATVLPCVLSTLSSSARPTVNFLCGRGTFRQFFCASAGQFVYFQCVCGHLRQLPSALCASAESPVNFNISCGHRTFRQLSVHPWDLSPTSISSLYVH